MYTRIFSKYDKKQGLHYLYLNGVAMIEYNGRLLAIANIYNEKGISLDYDLIVTTQCAKDFPTDRLVKRMKSFLTKAYKWTQDDARRKRYTLQVIDGHLPEVRLDFHKAKNVEYQY